METFEPQYWGYSTRDVKPFGDNGWVIASLDLPVIAIEADGWFCLLPTVYEQEWVPQARAMFG